MTRSLQGGLFMLALEAKVALNAMNGRFFGGRQIGARLYPKDAFRRREYTRQG